jgi:recombinational DNA repair protein (RecF pathway)
MNRQFHFEPFARATGLLQGFAVLIVTGSAIVLTSCAANQQMASTGTSPQEEQDRAVCLQHAHRDSGYNEKTFASCMTAKGYKKDNLYPSETVADAEPPPISDTLKDTLKKMAQSLSPDPNSAARPPDGENAEQISH